MIKRTFYTILLAGFVFALYSCGGNYAAPENYTITVNPSSFSVADGRSSEYTTTEYFQIIVKEPKTGLPVKDVKIWISFIWAVPNSDPVVQLYDGDTAEDSPMSVTTDKNGVYNLKIDFVSGGGQVYSGDLQVTSGSSYGSAEISVTAGSSSS